MGNQANEPSSFSWLQGLDAGMLFRFVLQGGILFFETLVLVLETPEEEED